MQNKILGLVVLCAWAIGATPKPFNQCPVIEKHEFTTLRLTPEDNLASKLASVPPKTTVLLADGVYKLSGTAYVSTNDIIVRSESGNTEKVIIDGSRGDSSNPSGWIGTVLQIKASNVSVSHLTIRYGKYHAVHIHPPSNSAIKNVHLNGLHIYDCSQQLVKINSNGNSKNLQWVSDGKIECSLFEFQNKSVMQNNGNYFYTGGIDVHGGYNWEVRKNIFKNLNNSGRLLEHGVHFWSRSRGSLVENNFFINVYRAIGFGMKYKAYGFSRQYEDGEGEEPYFDHVDGIIRNNVVFNEAGVHLETGIELSNVKNATVYHNTIVSVDKPFNSLEFRWPNTTVAIHNNLLSHQIMKRDKAKAVESGNIENAPLSLFRNGSSGDLHLVSTASLAIGKGEQIAGNLGFDMDGEPRSSSKDVGADSFSTGTSLADKSLPFDQSMRVLRAINGRVLQNPRNWGSPFIR